MLCTKFLAPSTTTTRTTTQTITCNGIPSTNWSCCSFTSPCDVGGGDCDTDAECAGDLKCGSDNCENHFPSGSWHVAADCCFSEYNHFI